MLVRFFQYRLTFCKLLEGQQLFAHHQEISSGQNKAHERPEAPARVAHEHFDDQAAALFALRQNDITPGNLAIPGRNDILIAQETTPSIAAASAPRSGRTPWDRSPYGDAQRFQA